MTKCIDLHTHTTASDGSMSPTEIVRHAKECGLTALATTDHDTVDGIEEALEEGKRSGIEVIPGVEIGVDFKTEMHILGYFTEQSYHNIKGVLANLRQNRDERNPKIISKLNELKYDITMEEVLAEAGGNVVGRPHIAGALLKKGYVKSVEEAFERLLGSGKLAYFPKDKLTPIEGISEITKAGGVAVLAHPIFLYLTNKKLDELLGDMKGYGLKGIEALYVENSQEDTGNLLRLAIKYDFIVTGGSDFHGNFKPDIQLGVGRGNLKVPYELLEKLKGELK